MRLFKKLIDNKWILRSIFKTIYFNFHYLPFKLAVRLPIILYKPEFISLKGKIVFDCPESSIKTGMVILGKNNVRILPNLGIKIELVSGIITFNGKCFIGNNSSLCIDNGGKLIFNNNFLCSSSLKLVCYNRIVFGENVRVGWENIIMDTDFHAMKKISGGYTKGYGEIDIGRNCWLATRCTVLKNTRLPDYTTASACSVLNKSFMDIPNYSIIGGNPASLKFTGLYRDPYDDVIEYKNNNSN